MMKSDRPSPSSSPARDASENAADLDVQERERRQPRENPRVTNATTATNAATNAATTAALPPPRGLRASSLVWDGEERLILSFPLPQPRWPKALTMAERAVAILLLDGATSAEIGRQRGTSHRTVTNQVASIFRKADVASRAELAALVFGSK